LAVKWTGAYQGSQGLGKIGLRRGKLPSRRIEGNVRALPSSNEHLDYIASLLDDMWSIPGTRVRFGLDALVGWIPGIGDAIAGAASCVIVFASWRRGVAPVTLARMVANILLETAVGGVPVVGDIFHVFWKANRRNYRLLMREKERPREKTARDWIFLLIVVLGAVATIAAPIIILIWLARSLVR
jgi:hypothetical protein